MHPAPPDPAPSSDPAPSDPAPSDPAPSDPAPSDPASSDPASPDPAPPVGAVLRAWAESVERENAQWAAHQTIVERRLEQDRRDGGAASARRRKRRAASSVVFTVRLSPEEMTALEMRAAWLGAKPSVLARNLIRRGLTSPSQPDLGTAVDDVLAAAARLRRVVE